jgi:RNA exonuclease 1
MRRLKETDVPPSLSNFSDIFSNLWLPKAPGTNTQLYSPISAFLNCPLTASQSLQRAREARNRKSTCHSMTSLTIDTSLSLESLLMSPNDMKIAGYPIHPLHDETHSDANYVSTPFRREPSGRKKTVIGIDCEMCITEQGSEITRVTLVDFQGKPLYDELVKPENPILDYLTPYALERRILIPDGRASLKNA